MTQEFVLTFLLVQKDFWTHYCESATSSVRKYFWGQTKVANIKTKNLTINIFCSPPFFFLAFSLFPCLFLYYCDFRANWVQTKQNPVLLHFFALRAANFARFIFKNWILNFGFMAKVKRQSHCNSGKPSFLLLHSLKPAVRAHCVDFFMWKNIPEQTEETLPSLSSSFRRPTFIGRVRSWLCAIFWKT